MFNFISHTDVSEAGVQTVAFLCDEHKNPIDGAGYMTFFNASERRTRINCQIHMDADHKRLSVCTHVHNEKRIGAAGSQFDGVTHSD